MVELISILLADQALIDASHPPTGVTRRLRIILPPLNSLLILDQIASQGVAKVALFWQMFTIGFAMLSEFRICSPTVLVRHWIPVELLTASRGRRAACALFYHFVLVVYSRSDSVSMG